MPELPEVETVAAALRARLLGRRLDAIKVRYARALKPSPASARRALLGRRLVGVDRHGKYLFLRFEVDDPAPNTLLLHLRMTGQVFVDPEYKPDKHLRLLFDFDGEKVFYRDIRKFGGFTLFDSESARNAVAHIGPDMLEVGFRQWRARLGGRKSAIKTLLLDQGIAAGLGNIYADEALFRAELHPERAVASMGEAELRCLWREARKVLRRAISHGGTTLQDFVGFTGQPGNFRGELEVYGRAGEPCPRCGVGIVRIRLGGRSAHFCPQCQPREPLSPSG